MGLDDLAQRLLGRIYSFSLPKVGVTVSPQRRGWAIAHASGETALRIPVAGRVSEVSEKLMELPSLANRDPYGQGAAFVVEPRDLAADLKPLHYGNDARLWYEREIERLTRELQERPTPEIGVTFQDGGEPVEDLSRLLGAEKHRALIERFLTGGASHARPRSRREKGR